MFKIGEFSRLSRVSLRMLRHYDKLSLLKPKRIDPVSRYRYYSADQLARLNRILAYRDLDFSLEQISGLLDDEIPMVDLLGILKRKHDQIERKIILEQFMLVQLEARIHEMNVSAGRKYCDVISHEIKLQLIASLRKVISENDNVQGMFEDLERYVN